MIHPIQSVVVRIQNRIANNFGNSKYGKAIKKYENIHNGETCFIIGNGPSLKLDDLNTIDKLNIPSFAFNRIFCVFDETDWRPTYYISQDQNVTTGQVDNFLSLNLPNMFFPIRWKWYSNISVTNGKYFNLVGNEELPLYNFSNDFSSIVYEAATVAYTAIQLAYYMGFKKIYLVGFDNNYSVMKDKDGNIVRDETVKDYFTDKYTNKDTDKLLVGSIYHLNKAFISVNEHIKSGEIDLEVFNATRGGKLDVFIRKDLDDIFKEIEDSKK